jgi:hypothetical protein
MCVLCASPTLLHAQNGIQIVSQSYNISASWTEDIYSSTAPPITYPLGDWSAGYSSYPLGGGYNLSSSNGSPVAVSTASPSPKLGFNPLTASSSINQFSVQNSASAYLENDSQGVGAGAAEWYLEGDIDTFVQADWFFQTTGNSLDINISAYALETYGWHFGTFDVALSDVTSSTSLLDVTPSGNLPGYSLTNDYSFAVNPSDIYKFSISESTLTSDIDFPTENVTASITSTPEPGICSLLSLGLAGLLGLRSKFSS